MVPCLLVIAIGGILTKIFLNAFVQIKAHGFRVSNPETANAVPLARNPILARGGAERFQAKLTELSAGSLSMTAAGEEFLPGPREEAR